MGRDLVRFVAPLPPSLTNRSHNNLGGDVNVWKGVSNHRLSAGYPRLLWRINGRTREEASFSKLENAEKKRSAHPLPLPNPIPETGGRVPLFFTESMPHTTRCPSTADRCFPSPSSRTMISIRHQFGVIHVLGHAEVASVSSPLFHRGRGRRTLK